MGRPVGSKNVSSIQSSDVIKNKCWPEATEHKESARRSKKTVPCKMKESRLRHKVDDIVGRPIDFFPFTKLPQNKVVDHRYLSVRERHKTMSRDAMAGEMTTELVSLIWTVHISLIAL